MTSTSNSPTSSTDESMRYATPEKQIQNSKFKIQNSNLPNAPMPQHSNAPTPQPQCPDPRVLELPLPLPENQLQNPGILPPTPSDAPTPELSNSPAPKKSAKSADNSPTLSPKSKIQNPPTPSPSQEGDRIIQNPPTPSPSQEGDRIIHNPVDSFRMSFAPLSLDEVYQLADDEANGAIVVMSGMVRNQTDGKPVVALEYQAYEPMALNIFRQIAGEIREQWSDVTHVVIHHRTGKLTVGEISVLVAVGCPHRSEAFVACQYAIDTLKHNAPIWKKEHWDDGSTSWVSIAACETQDDC